MKFVTEIELRDLYRKEPFATYVLEPDTKITPGARQFLVDRRVTLVQAQCCDDKNSDLDPSNRVQVRDNWCTQRLLGRMESVEALFLLVAAELLHSGDAVLSEEIMALGKCFRNLRKAEREKVPPDIFEFWGWSEEEIKQRSDNLEKFVDLREFHVGLENGKEVALLNYLRASLQEVEPAILEAYWNEEQQVCSRQDLIETINRIINILGIMMWKCLGGKKWRK